MIVDDTIDWLVGSVDLRIIFFPSKWMFSTYVPGETMISSPAVAASMAAWMVGWSPGTVIVAAGTIPLNIQSIITLKAMHKIPFLFISTSSALL
jgi:hypothetical protein